MTDYAAKQQLEIICLRIGILASGRDRPRTRWEPDHEEHGETGKHKRKPSLWVSLVDTGRGIRTGILSELW